MFRALKNWMSVLVLFALIAAQVVPASALTISFQTMAAPIKIISTTLTQNQLDVGYTPTIRVDFSRDVNWIGVRNFAYDATHVNVTNTSVGPVGNAAIYVELNGQTLMPGTKYYLEFFLKDTDMNSMDPADPANAPYYDAGSGNYRLYFTTASAAGWQSTDIGGAAAGSTGGQTNVHINATIKVTTTAALNSATVIAANIKLYKGAVGDMSTPVAINDPTLDGTGKIITVAPASNLLYGTWYHLELTNVADTVGNVLP